MHVTYIDTRHTSEWTCRALICVAHVTVWVQGTHMWQSYVIDRHFLYYSIRKIVWRMSVSRVTGWHAVARMSATDDVHNVCLCMSGGHSFVALVCDWLILHSYTSTRTPRELSPRLALQSAMYRVWSSSARRAAKSNFTCNNENRNEPSRDSTNVHTKGCFGAYCKYV